MPAPKEVKVSVEPLTTEELTHYNQGETVSKPDTSDSRYQIEQRNSDAHGGFTVERKPAGEGK